MGLTFDEAQNLLLEQGLDDEIAPLVIYVMGNLKDTYAPTVEMTKSQKDLILQNQDEDKLYEIMADGDGYYFDSFYWGDLEPHEVASAYLHPETIKIVDE